MKKRVENLKRGQWLDLQPSPNRLSQFVRVAADPYETDAGTIRLKYRGLDSPMSGRCTTQNVQPGTKFKVVTHGIGS